MRRAECVSQVVRTKMYAQFLSEKLQGRYHWGNLSIYGRMIVKCGVKMWTAC